MATLLVEIADADVEEITNIIKAKGGNSFNADAGDEDLTVEELESLRQGLKELILIQSGKLKGIPFSELWND